jgi:hypothetical protein
VQVIDTTREPLRQAKVEADVYALDGKLLLHREATLDAPADDVTKALHLDLAPLLGDATVLVHLALHSHDGALLSENLYWRAASDAGYRALDTLAQADVTLAAEEASGNTRSIRVYLKNTSAVAALNTKLTVVHADDDSEVLPTFYSDNYISLLPGEERLVTVDLPGAGKGRALRVKLRGWNANAASTDVGGANKSALSQTSGLDGVRPLR